MRHFSPPYAHRLGQPVILGYLLAGMAIGPFTPGAADRGGPVQSLTEIEVALLTFALGAEIPLAGLRDIGGLAMIGGPLQILCTMAIGPLLAPMLDLT